MGDTSIEWTDKTWNPIAAYYEGKRGWMCSKPSTGCKHCYSERLNLRLGNGLLYTSENAAKVEWRLVNLDEPGKWRKPQKCFVESMGDLFHEALPDELIGRVWSKMLEFPLHTFQVLTKRPGRMRELVTRFTEEAERKGLRSADHIWLGTSVENQEQAEKRIPELLRIQAKVRFLSCEPLLGDIDLNLACANSSEWNNPSLRRETKFSIGYAASLLDWVIVGGESGHGARPMQMEWARSLRDQCMRAHVAFHFKQFGEHAPTGEHRDGKIFMNRVGKKAAGRVLDGRMWNEFPEA